MRLMELQRLYESGGSLYEADHFKAGRGGVVEEDGEIHWLDLHGQTHAQLIQKLYPHLPINIVRKEMATASILCFQIIGHVLFVRAGWDDLNPAQMKAIEKLARKAREKPLTIREDPSGTYA